MDWMIIGIGIGMILGGFLIGLPVGLSWGSRAVLDRVDYPHMKRPYDDYVFEAKEIS
jgi:hypothetical protein